MRKFIRMLLATAVTLIIGISLTAQSRDFTPATFTEIAGKIHDVHGRPAVAFKISLRNWLGDDLASAVTDQNGAYDLRQVIPGRYHFNFRPLAEESLGETIIINVPGHFFRMNLTVLRNPPALVRSFRTNPPVS